MAASGGRAWIAAALKTGSESEFNSTGVLDIFREDRGGVKEKPGG
jgi:hypothetical protein